MWPETFGRIPLNDRALTELKLRHQELQASIEEKAIEDVPDEILAIVSRRMKVEPGASGIANRRSVQEPRSVSLAQGCGVGRVCPLMQAARRIRRVRQPGRSKLDGLGLPWGRRAAAVGCRGRWAARR